MKQEPNASGCHRLLFDTNALVDFSCPSYERPRHDDVAKVVTQMLIGDHQAYVPMGSLKDTYYLLRRMGNDHRVAIYSIMRILKIFSTVDLCERHVHMALSSDEPDFEDGFIRAQAEDLGVDAIITDDRKAFAGSTVPSYSARECLERFWPQEEQSEN